MTSSPQLKLSVIIPFYRELCVIGRAIDSVLMNLDNVTSVEIFVCNDGPFLEEDIRARLCSRGNAVSRILKNQYGKGPGGARNTGLDASTGHVIAFLDADDFWLPGKLAAQLKEVATGATFVATAYRFDNGTNVTAPSAISLPRDVFLRRGIGTSTVLITRSLLGNTRFKEIRFAQDIDFWYALASSPRFRYSAIDACSVVYNSNGSTSNKWQQLQHLMFVLRINKVSRLVRARVVTSYILVGIYRHYVMAILVSLQRGKRG